VKLDRNAHAESKRRAREQTVAAIHAAIEIDFSGFASAV
jgi:hypothetical protein